MSNQQTDIQVGDELIYKSASPAINNLTPNKTYTVLEVQLGLIGSMEPMINIIDDKGKSRLLYAYIGYRFLKIPKQRNTE
ncbi:MAG: hypothetical protein [Podoviridae sp. ctLUJ1]|nr:MAG: hypothetical protein [Podoviridae sp. ctLUJ1]